MMFEQMLQSKNILQVHFRHKLSEIINKHINQTTYETRK